MPDLGPLNSLTRGLRDAMRLTAGSHGAGWVPPGNPMHQAFKDVKKVLGGDDDATRPGRDDMLAAVRKFLRQRKVESFTQLKYVCYGVTVPVDPGGGRLIDKTSIFQLLLEMVLSKQVQAKQFRRCYQGLLAAYFGFDRHSATVVDAGQNWHDLRGYLNDQLEPVAAAARRQGRSPVWLEVLEGHRNLLTDKPCERYAIAMRAGDRTELEGVCAGLDISPTSWVWHEAVMAYVHEVARADHAAFQNELSQVLVMVDGDRKQHQLPELVARNAVALCVARYAKCRDKPEHAALRDVSLRRIGNPWLKRAAWDATVKSEPARQMVESWLKRRLIKDFFELLALDGAADLRRLKYWLKWEPQISDMWFVLGTGARLKKTHAFLELRERMKGRERHLTGATTDNNNAFVMRIGDQLVVEFGVTGNACFAFPADKRGLDLDHTQWDIYDLKHQPGYAKLSHGWNWESKFDAELCALLRQTSPPKPPPPAPQVVKSKGDIEKSNLPGPTVGAGPGAASYSVPPAKPQGTGTLPPIAPAATRLPLVRAVNVPTIEKVDIPESPPVPQAPRAITGVQWPSYTPPAGSSVPIRARAEPEDAAVPSLPHHPVDTSSRQREALKFRCQRYGVTFEEPASDRSRTWIRLKNPASAPDVAQLAIDIGFAHVPGVGFYADQPVKSASVAAPIAPAPPAEAVAGPGSVEKVNQAKQLELLRRLCAMEGVGFDDNRSKGGALWVRLVGVPASSSLVAMLKRMHFKLAPGKGYYLSGDD